MAAKYRKIDPRIWTDESFIKLESSAKLVALYCITAQSNRCGLFQFSCAKAAEETAIEPDSYAIAFTNVCRELGWKYDDQRRVLYLPTWWKYNPPENSKHLEGCLKDLEDLPHSPLLKDFAVNTRHLPDHSVKAFQIAMDIAVANQEQKQEQEQKNSLSACADATDPSPSKAKERKQPVGPHHELIRTFCDAWGARYGERYTFTGKDAKHIKWILEQVDSDLPRAKKIVSGFISDEDPWLVDKAHSLGILVSGFNKFKTERRVNHARKTAGATNGEYESDIKVAVRKLPSQQRSGT